MRPNEIEVLKLIIQLSDDFNTTEKVAGAMTLKRTAAASSRQLVRQCHGATEAPNPQKIHCIYLGALAVKKAIENSGDTDSLEDPELHTQIEVELADLIGESHSRVTLMEWGARNLSHVADHFDFSREGWAEFEDLLKEALAQYIKDTIIDDLTNYANDMILMAEIDAECGDATEPPTMKDE